MAPPSTDQDPDDALTQSSQAVASLTAQGAGATTYTLGLPAGDPLLYNPWNPIALSAMSTPSLNAAATLPYLGAQRHGASIAQFGGPAPQQSQLPQKSFDKGDSEVENPGTPVQQAAKVPEETVSTEEATAEEEKDVSSDDLSDVKMSDGSESRMSSESDADLDRQDRYAFNHASQAYDHRIPQNLTGGTPLYAEKVCMGTTIHQHLDNAEKRGILDVHPNLVPHELEMKPGPKASKCIWVGMLPAVLQDGEDDSTEGQTKEGPKTPSKGQKRAKKPQSLIDLEDDQLNIIPQDPKALRVVAKVQAKQVKTWHLYALTKSDTGSKLCQGWKVALDEVFFFKAFRDDTATGPMKRRQATERKIKAMIFPPGYVPAVVPPGQSSTPSKHAASPVADPVTPTIGNLPSPESNGKKENSGHALRNTTAKPAFKDGAVQKEREPLAQEDQEGSSADSDQGEISPVAEKQSQGVDIRAAGAVDVDGGEDAYPEHAVSSSDPTFKSFLDSMVGDLSVVSEVVKPGQKRKRVAFDAGCDESANTRRKTGGSSRSDTQAQPGENGGDEPSSFVIGEQTRHLSLRLKSMVDRFVAKQDVAGLRQCVTMMGCIERRGSPSPESALAPYLSISSKKDADPQACKAKLREILDLFPSLENVEPLNKHVLSYMIRGLRETGQSIEAGLIEACIKSYSRLYKVKNGDNSRANMERLDNIDMICQARDDAEKMLKKAPLKKKRVAHHWVDPRYAAEPIDDE